MKSPSNPILLEQKIFAKYHTAKYLDHYRIYAPPDSKRNIAFAISHLQQQIKELIHNLDKVLEDE